VKLFCQQTDLLEAVTIVHKAITPQNTLPILGNILLKAEGQKLYLAATNLEIAISTSFSVSVKNEGKITLPARILLSYISLLKNGEIELSLEGGDTLSLKTEGIKTRLKGLSSEEFPIIPSVEKDESFYLDSDTLRKAIEEVVFCAASSTTRPVLSGVYLWGKNSEIRLVATDSYRLGEKRIPLKEKIFKEELKNIIPARTMQELARILSGIKEKKKVEIISSKTQILFRIGNTELTSRLIEGIFPEYLKIIPTSSKTKTKVPIPELILGIKRVGIFARENNNNIKFSFFSNEINITTDATEIGSEESKIKAEGEGPENEIALNGQYFLDVLQNIEGETVNIELEEKLSPVVIKPKKEGLTHIIMPLKI